MTKTTPRRMITQPYDFSVQDLVDKINAKDIDLKPDYQRNYVWATNDDKENKRSRLIESLLLNIPIPVIYFAEQEETLKYEVIDGQQRLKTFDDFLNDKFALKDLEIRSDVNGKKYSELEQKDKDEIRKRSVRAIVILNESDEEVKFEVFERLNLGSVQLTPQEIRNNTLRGNFNDLLKELAKNKLFRKMLNLRLKKDQDNMAYEEMILRFFTYYKKGLKRVENLSYFLTEFMKENKNMESIGIDNLRNLFEATIKKIDQFLGKNAFSVYQKNTDKWYPTSNRALYDTEMLAFASVQESEIKVTPKKFEEELKKLMEDNEFKKSLNEQAGGKKIAMRAESVKRILTQSNVDISA
ncbi:MAG: DUF262 domain-containing protein [Patescibacteria group bacterium]